MEEWASGSRGFSRQASRAYSQRPFNKQTFVESFSYNTTLQRDCSIGLGRSWGVGNQLNNMERIEVNSPTVEQTRAPHTNWLEFPTPSALWTVDRESWEKTNTMIRLLNRLECELSVLMRKSCTWFSLLTMLWKGGKPTWVQTHEVTEEAIITTVVSLHCGDTGCSIKSSIVL